MKYIQIEDCKLVKNHVTLARSGVIQTTISSPYMLRTFLLFIAFLCLQTSDTSSEIYEGWLDPDSTGPIQPLWMELHEDKSGQFTGWYVHRIELDTVFFKGERGKKGITLKVMANRTVIKEQFTLHESENGLEGIWKPAKGYGSDIRLFKTESDFAKTMQVSINPNILRKGKGKQDSISDIQYLMVRKGIASIKVYRERNDGHRPWISYHVIDLMKNKEIQLTDYLIDHAFAAKKIDADSHAEDVAVEQLKQYAEDELSIMQDCGMNLDQELHLDNVVLYPNRTAITFDYLNVFGMHEECEHLMYPIQYTLPIEEFKTCIRTGSFLSRLLIGS